MGFHRLGGSAARFFAASAVVWLVATGWQQTAAAQPTNAGVAQLLQQANDAFAAGRLDDAASLFERVIVQDRSQLDAYIKLSAIAYAKKDFAQAIARADAGLAVQATDELRGKKAIALMASGKKDEGVKLAEQATAGGACLFDVQLALGQHYEKLPEPATQKLAAEMYKKFLGCRPPELAKLDDQIRTKLALSALKGGEFKMAETELQVLVKKKPDDSTAQQLLAAAYTGMGKYNEAIAKYQSLLSLAKSQPGIYYNLGFALFKVGRYKDATSSANQYLASKKDEKGYLLLGDVQLAEKNYAGALASFQSAEKLNPQGTQPKLRMAEVYFKQKAFAKAKPILEKAVSANSSDMELLRKLGETYLALKDPQAMGVLAKVAKAQPDNADAQVSLGKAQLENKKLSEAKTSFRAALKLAEGNVEAKTGLVTVLNREAGVAFDAGKWADAQTTLDEAVQLDPASAMSQRNLALVYMQQGKFGEAVRTLGVPLKKQPNDLILNRLLARAQLGAKKTGDAIETYQRAEATAVQQRQEPVLAEIYAELCPLLMAMESPNLDDIVTKLERANTAGVRANPELAKVVKRNLALALFRRGMERLRAKNGDGVSDLRRAQEDPSILTAKEPQLFAFAYGLALLTTNTEQAANEAIGLFSKLDAKMTASFLRPPYDKLGPDFFKAYANYMQDSPAKRDQAAETFQSVLKKAGSSPLAGKIRDLIRSSYELKAYDAWRSENFKQAKEDLKNAQKFATTGAQKAELEVNLAVLDMDKDRSGAKRTFDSYKGTTPEALVNLGIILDLEGDSRGALDAWQDAQKRGVGGKVRDWIEAKKKILGSK